MTIASTTTKQAMLGDGTTRSWPFTFRAWMDEVRVIVADAAGLEIDVTALSRISLKANGGTVVYPADAKTPALPPGHRIVIMRAMDFVQETRLINVTRFDPQVIEDQLDRLIANDQQLQEQVDRALTVNVTSDRDPATVIEEVFQARDRAEHAATSAGNSEDAATASAQAAAESATAAGVSAQQAEAWAQDAKDASTQGPTATPAQKGLVPAGGTSGQVYRVNTAGNAYDWEGLPTATAETPGLLRPDGKSTFVDGDGTLSASGVPLLSIQKFPLSTVQPGYLSVSQDNGRLTVTTFPEAAAQLATLKAAGETNIVTLDAWEYEAATNGGVCARFALSADERTFRVPYAPGRFWRALDAAGGRTVGMSKADTMRPITGKVGAQLVGAGGTSGAVGALTNTIGGVAPAFTGATTLNWNGIDLDSSKLGTNYAGAETAPVHAVAHYQIRMYGTVSDAGTVTLAQLIAAMAGKLDTSTYSASTFGIGQTLQILTGSRTKNTVYQNTSGKPIFVMLNFSGGSGAYGQVYLGGSATSLAQVSQVGIANGYLSTSFIVPDGWYYKLGELGTITVQNWSEFR